MPAVALAKEGVPLDDATGDHRQDMLHPGFVAGFAKAVTVGPVV